MRERLQYVVVALLGLLLAIQLLARFARPRTATADEFVERRVGDVVPELAVNTYLLDGGSISSNLGAVIGPGCAVLIVVDSDCKGCRDALEIWKKDTTWGSLSSRLRWLVIKDGDTAAVRTIRTMDPSANVSGLKYVSDLFRLGVRAWPAAIVLDSARKILARPAPFPIDIRIDSPPECVGASPTASTGSSPRSRSSK